MEAKKRPTAAYAVATLMLAAILYVAGYPIAYQHLKHVQITNPPVDLMVAPSAYSVPGYGPVEWLIDGSPIAPFARMFMLKWASLCGADAIGIEVDCFRRCFRRDATTKVKKFKSGP